MPRSTARTAAADPPATAPWPVRLRLARACELAQGSRRLPLAPTDGLLLAWLALQGPTPREQLARLLWPDNAPAAARNALRQRLFRLHRLAGYPLVTGTATLALAAAVGHDLDEQPALLEGLEPEGPGELQDWLHEQRLQRGRAARHRLEASVAALEAAGDLAAALAQAETLLLSDPLSEDAHRRVMRLHYLRGDTAAALLAFDRCEAVLKHEVGARPSSETLALLALLQSPQPRPADVARQRLPAALLRPPRLVGRDRELRQLAQAWGEGSRVLVVGEAGIGKSRLLQTLAAHDASLVATAARPGDALVPLATVARLLDAVAARLQSPLDDGLRRRLGPLLPMSGATLASAGSRDTGLLSPLRQLLRLAAPHLGGLVLDDLHFADDASVELLQALLGAPRDLDGDGPIRWCLGLRPPVAHTPVARLVATLATAGPCLLLNVGPLAEPQLAELVDSLRLPGPPGLDWAPVLRQRSGGNPLFALETLKLAWSEGLLDDPAAAQALPRSSSLQQLIEQQLGRLSPPALMLARLAAIAGVDFTVPLAEQVLQQGALQLADAWHELEAAQVLVGTAFAHDLVFEAVLARLPEVIARHLHGQVARTLEQLGSAPARLAAHWERAGDPGRALPHLRAAAQHAHRALREPERIEYLLRAADIAEQRGETDLAFGAVADAVKSHMNTIRHASGFVLLDRLDRLARTPAQHAEALGQRAWYCTQLADSEGALRHGQQALARAETLSDPLLGLVIRHRLATALSLVGRFDEALAHFELLQEPLRTCGSQLRDEDLAELHGNHAVVLDNLGRAAAADTQRRLALAAAQRAGDAAQQVTQRANQAVSELARGQPQQALGSLDQAARLVQTFEMTGSTVGFVAVLRCQAERAVGRLARALAAADDAEQLLATSTPARLPVVHLNRGHCWLDLGQTARALQQLQAAGESLAPHLQARRCLLLARTLPREREVWLARADAALPRHGWPEITLLVRLEQARQRPAGGRAAQRQALQALQLAAADAGLAGVQRAACAVRFELCTDGLEPATAGDVERALALLAVPVGAEDGCAAMAYVLELPWQASRLLAAQGLAAEAASLRQRLRRWLLDDAAQALAQPLRDSFLQRNPVNRALLAATG